MTTDKKCTISSPEKLGKAINEEQDTIIIEGDLANKTFRIKITGKVAWGFVYAGLIISVTMILVANKTETNDSQKLYATALVPAAASVSILGISTTIAAITMAVAGKSIKTLYKLRNYKVAQHSKNLLVLTRN